MAEHDAVLAFARADPEHTGIFLDFDGTLSAIVPVPEDAVPVAGAVDALERLVRRFALVAVVSGRSLADLRARVPVAGALLAGSYGRERSDRPGRPAGVAFDLVAEDAARKVAPLAGVRIERKAAGVAMHYRAVPHHADAVRALAARLGEEYGLQVRPGRMVVELTAVGPGKGDAILDLLRERRLARAIAAGDDWGDLEGFVKLRENNIDALIVAVSSAEAPPALDDVADVIVRDPRELVDVLRAIAAG